MARAFSTLKPNLYQSDYIVGKDAKLIYCNKKTLDINVNSSGQYDLYKKGKFLIDKRCKKYLIDKNHLAYGLYKKKDLTNICSVIVGHPCTNYTCPQCLEPVPITKLGNTDPAFYQTNSILSTFFGCPEKYQ